MFPPPPPPEPPYRLAVAPVAPVFLTHIVDNHPGFPFVPGLYPPAFQGHPLPPSAPFPDQFIVVPVKSRFPLHFMIVTHPVGVIVTVFAPGAKLVYFFIMTVSFDPVIVKAPAHIAPSEPFPNTGSASAGITNAVPSAL